VSPGCSRSSPSEPIVDKLNLDRMRRTIIEAAEQCGRYSLADIDEPVRLEAFLRARDPDRMLYFCR
jgi:16S rRNA (uracil1498-N3)-methyltransferase